MRWLPKWWSGISHNRKTTSQRRRSVPLRVEALESRDVLTAFTSLQLHEAGQYMLELINRARTDPAAEAARPDYGIDLNEGLAPGTISADPKQPLAPNEWLLQTIEGHLSV